jgi:hypothetical protein
LGKPSPKQGSLILSYVFGAKAVGGVAEITAELFYRSDVLADGGIGEVAALQLFQHDLA